MTTASRPALLEDLAGSPPPEIVEGPGMLAFPRHWQVPAATEKTAWERVAARGGLPGARYLGMPWATAIDGLRTRAAPTLDILRALGTIRRHPHPEGAADRIVTVAQHIYADRYVGLFRGAGVTDLFWSHATVNRPEIAGIRIHPFPLFPAQTPDGIEPADPHRPRRWLANFVGAYNPKVYITDVRARIFETGGADDVLIVRREAWHFDRAVYAEQMKGVAPDAARLALERQHRDEYLQAIRDSVFTLCPTGSGPNSIRIGEALALGSIPVILTRDLALPGDRALWEACCLFEDDSAEGYTRALAAMRAMPAAEIRARQTAARDLFAMIGPSAYADLVIGRLAVTAPAG